MVASTADGPSSHTTTRGEDIMNDQGSHLRRHRLGGIMAALLVSSACTTGDAAEASLRMLRGPAAPLGEGTARTYVLMRGDSVVEVGVRLTERALFRLPGPHDAGAVHIHGDPSFATMLEMPAGAATPYRHVYLTWNPNGHEPPGIYDVGHFDFHFYMVDNDVRLAIDPADPAYQAKAESQPDPAFVPEGYVLPAPLAFPRMGVHWVHPASPELNGQPFTHTFIYGTWDGALIFAEPMVTRTFLKSKQSASAHVAQPERYAAPGHYATRYVVDWDESTREHRVALTDLARRD
jgi:hypothetical protein